MVYRRAGAEFVGTFVLVFGGAGAAVIAGEPIGVLGIAFAFGLSLLVMAYAVGPISGCHINPAVTLGLLVRGKIEMPEAVRYWGAQVLGAIAAAGILLAIVASRKDGYDGPLARLVSSESGHADAHSRRDLGRRCPRPAGRAAPASLPSPEAIRRTAAVGRLLVVATAARRE